MRLDKYYLLLSQVFLALANWGLLAIIARYYSPETTGEYGLVLAIINPVFLLFSFQLRNHYLSHPDSKTNFTVYLKLRLFNLLPMLFLASAIHFLFELSHGLFFSALLLKCSEILFELPFMVDHQQERLKKASLKHFLRTLIVYGSLITAITLGFNLYASIALSGLIGILIFISYFLSIVKVCSNKETSKSFKALYKETLPLGLAASAISLNVSLPRFYLSKLIDKEAVAAFTIVFTFYSLWQLIINSFLNAQLPKFKEIPFSKKIFTPVCGLFVFCLVFFSYGSEVYTLLFGSKYPNLAQYNFYLLTSIALSFLNSYLFYSFLSLNNYKSHLKINSISTLVNASLLYPFIVHFGIKGAMTSWILSQLCQALLYLYTKKKVTWA